jgi:hypothetical protein
MALMELLFEYHNHNTPPCVNTSSLSHYTRTRSKNTPTLSATSHTTAPTLTHPLLLSLESPIKTNVVAVNPPRVWECQPPPQWVRWPKAWPAHFSNHLNLFMSCKYVKIHVMCSEYLPCAFMWVAEEVTHEKLGIPNNYIIGLFRFDSE